ncbi:hypothetical protein [Enteractinococcus coprophilus]|uniref:Secreted protein n=1 Tax=Enteractinococcus coprophilus TaxID=1027633 RepID=A0A543AF25_9MICC|nr:hypothetical protein [Enteractinococcus coprophilus]TQL71182.1 hypothetical protein FB556_1651 [Enteractinococcus coprophilus]
MFKENVSKRSKLYAGFAGVAALALFTACADDPAQEEPVDPGVEQQDPTQDDPMQEDPLQESPAEDPMQESPAEDPGTEGEIDGAGVDSATSTVGFVGNSISWAL